MKYVLFAIGVMNVVPLAILLFIYKSWTRYAVWLLILPAMFFDQTALNFFSHEEYRGTSRGMEISLVYLIALSILLSRFLARGYRALFPENGSRLYLLYMLLCLPSFWTAESRLFSFCELWKMMMMHLVFLAVFYFLCDFDDYKTLLWTFGFLVFCNFLMVVKEHLVGTYQVQGMFPHQNSLSIYMGLLGNLFLAYYLNRSDQWSGYLALLLFLLASATLFRTYSRGAILLYPCGCGITALMTVWCGRGLFRLHRLGVVALCGVIGGMIFVIRVVERFESAPESSGDARVYLAKSAREMIKDEPLRGVGLNNWGIKINPPYEYSKLRSEQRLSDSYKDGLVETIYLMVGAECGIPGLIALLVWFGYYLVIACRLARKLAGTALVFMPIGLTGGLAEAYVHSTLEWILKQQINFMQLMILYAVLSYLNRNVTRLKKQCSLEDKKTLNEADMEAKP